MTGGPKRRRSLQQVLARYLRCKRRTFKKAFSRIIRRGHVKWKRRKDRGVQDAA